MVEERGGGSGGGEPMMVEGKDGGIGKERRWRMRKKGFLHLGSNGNLGLDRITLQKWKTTVDSTNGVW